uniref:Uncharacterized protein n=1 Tax=Arundo donax TaxID=35708 RepID=A0A0A9GE31_ARUDO
MQVKDSRHAWLYSPRILPRSN